MFSGHYSKEKTIKTESQTIKTDLNTIYLQINDTMIGQQINYTQFYSMISV